MSQPTFYSAQVRGMIAAKFVERFKADPNYPFAKKTVQEIVDSFSPGRTVGTLKTVAPTLQKEVEDLCQAELGKLPPTLGARGVLIHRNGNGNGNGAGIYGSTLTGRQTHHEEPELGGNGTPPPAEREAQRQSNGRVKWTEDERTLVVEQAIEMWQQDPSEGMTHVLFTRAAKKILAAERQRVFTGLHSCEDLRERAVKLAKSILAQAGRPPEIQIKEVEVEKPLDLDAVLNNVPLDRLAGALAAGEMRLKMRQYSLAPIHLMPGSAPAAAAASASVSAPPEPAGPTTAQRIKEIEATFPHVQVICFRGHQHDEFVKQFKDHPIVIHKSIDPSAPLNRSLIAPAPTVLLLETEKSPVEWRSLVITVLGEKEAYRRDPCFGPNKVIHHAKELAGKWAAMHPKELTEWKILRAQLR